MNSSGELEFYAPVALARMVLCFRVLLKGRRTSVVFLGGRKFGRVFGRYKIGIQI